MSSETPLTCVGTPQNTISVLYIMQDGRGAEHGGKQALLLATRTQNCMSQKSHFQEKIVFLKEEEIR